MTMGFRAPLGNAFPIEEWKGKNLVFVAGGIALPPMRAVIDNVLDRRDEFGDVTIVYGAKTVNDLVYKDELKEWDERPDVTLVQTVDPGLADSLPIGRVKWASCLLCLRKDPKSDNTVAIVCRSSHHDQVHIPCAGKDLGFKDENTFPHWKIV